MLIEDILSLAAYALPMFRERRPTSTHRQEEKLRKDPVKSHRPDLPVTGPGWIYIMPSSYLHVYFLTLMLLA